MSDRVADFEPIIAEHAELVADADETIECGVCGGTTARIGDARYFRWRGELRIAEVWSCDDCRTSGNRLLCRKTGRVVRLSHVHTGSGFETPDAGGELVADGGHRPPCEAVENMDPTPPDSFYDLERRVCPNCRLYFDVGASTEKVFCSDACRRRHERGELVADGGVIETDDDEVLACPECDKTPVVTNSPGARNGDKFSKYRCPTCTAHFDEPKVREDRGGPGIRDDCLAAKLENAEPDDLVTDGGVDQDASLDDLRCLAWVGGDECPNTVRGIEDGVPLCDHHLDKSGIYDFPRIALNAQTNAVQEVSPTDE